MSECPIQLQNPDKVRQKLLTGFNTCLYDAVFWRKET